MAFPHGLPESGSVTVRQGHFAIAAFDRDELWADPDDDDLFGSRKDVIAELHRVVEDLDQAGDAVVDR